MKEKPISNRSGRAFMDAIRGTVWPFPLKGCRPTPACDCLLNRGGESIEGRSGEERERKILRGMRHAPFLDREPAGTKIHPLIRSHLQRRCHLPPVAGTFAVVSMLKSTIIYVICHGLTAVFILRHMCMNRSQHAVRVVRQTCSSSLSRRHDTRMHIVNGIKQVAGKCSVRLLVPASIPHGDRHR